MLGRWSWSRSSWTRMDKLLMSPLSQLAQNRVLWCSFAAWLAAQLIKTIRSLILTRRLNLSYITASGGMPSSHSALVVGLATAIARLDGMQSTSFALAAVL